MLSYMRPYAALIVAALVLAVFAVAFEGLSLWFSASLVQTIFSHEAPIVSKPEYTLSNANDILKYWTSNAIGSREPMAALQIVCAMMSLSFLLKNIFLYLKVVAMYRLNILVVRDMRNQLFTHALALPVSYYDRSKSGNIVSLVVNDVTNINNSMTGTFDKIFVEPMRLIFFVATLFVINYKFALAIFIIFPLLGALITAIGRTVRRRSKRVMERLAALLSILHETVSGIRIVKIFGTQDAESAKFRDENSRFVRHSFSSNYIGALSSPITEVMGVVVVVILLWYGGSQVLRSGGFGAEDFTRFLVFLFSVFRPLKEISKLNTTLQTGFASADRVFAALDSAAETTTLAVVERSRNARDQNERSESPVSFNDKIEFSNVNFSYPGCEETVLDNICFEIKKGSVAALVGASGSGKSTTLDLLPRFYDITSGKIAIDGVDTREMNLADLRKLFGIVAQETFLFNDTISANIAYGLQNADKDSIVAAARAANAWEFIEKLPQGLDTIVGERGVMLSGGQRQRLSIARALLLNPPILILDEATSSLDTESERLVQSAINKVMENRTVLVVAHRLSTIRHADQILVLDAGKIAERGTHDELLGLNKRYKYFYDIQFAGN
jgi:subfamily B ATP-binding cassette protein MsbA